MSDHSITSLIEKLEGAEAGSRELDALVWLALHPKGEIAIKGAGRPGLTNWRCRIPGATIANSWTNPDRGTTSLDAALALAERVLTLGAWDVGYYYNSDRPHYARLVIVRDDEGQPEIYGRAATPALALCAALLRAQSEARV